MVGPLKNFVGAVRKISGATLTPKTTENFIKLKKVYPCTTEIQLSSSEIDTGLFINNGSEINNTCENYLKIFVEFNQTSYESVPICPNSVCYSFTQPLV